jgi:hypothetical protein
LRVAADWAQTEAMTEPQRRALKRLKSAMKRQGISVAEILRWPDDLWRGLDRLLGAAVKAELRKVVKSCR